MKRLLGSGLVLVLALVGCSARSGTTSAPTGSADVASGDFGTLKNVCHPGTASPATGTGITPTSIQLGVFSDVGFTKNREFIDAAKVFTSWCNAAGGVGGRRLVPVTHDTNLTQVVPAMLQACGSDFALVGGGAALDGIAVRQRLSCLLPEFPAQSIETAAVGSDLQVLVSGASVGYSYYAGYWSWLSHQAFPDSAGAVGIIAGDSPVTRPTLDQDRETLTAIGDTVAYTDLYPVMGAADWTPYAEAIKNKHIKGLVFLGDPVPLERALTTIGYHLDWIDTNSNSYTPAMIQLAGSALDAQPSFADLQGVDPLEDTTRNPATQQVVDLYARYDPGAQITLPALRAFSAWLLFATAADQCPTLTRTCVYQHATQQTAWTAGGLQAPVDLSTTTAPQKCFNVVKATPHGWTIPDFGADTGPYRCNQPTHRYTGNYGQPTTLADVGKTMADVH